MDRRAEDWKEFDGESSANSNIEFEVVNDNSIGGQLMWCQEHQEYHPITMFAICNTTTGLRENRCGAWQAMENRQSMDQARREMIKHYYYMRGNGQSHRASYKSRRNYIKEAYVEQRKLRLRNKYCGEII